MTTYYKCLLEDGNTTFNRPGWALPKGSRPGRWMPKINDIVMCRSGYHVCDFDHLRDWIGPAIYRVEVRGKHLDSDNKSVWQQARLIDRVEGWGTDQMVEWAKACADHVAHVRVAANAAYAADYAAYAADYAAYAADYAAAYNGASNAERQYQTDLLHTMLNIPKGTS